jgi:hypothetical protein
MRDVKRQDGYENMMMTLTEDDLYLVSGGGEADRTCSGPTVCDAGGHCEDSQGVCTPK